MLKNKRGLFLILGLTLLVLVVLIPLLGSRLTYSAASKTKVAVLDVPRDSTPTATAFQPLTSTETYIPTDYPTSTPTITPQPENIKPVSNSQGVDPISQPDGQINIILLGSDQRFKGYIGRTDTIILVTINTKENTVSVTSFPRDLYIFIPKWTDQRINTAFAHGGFPILKQTFMHNFGFEPDYYILLNLWTFEHIINDLGGIYVDVPQTVCDDNWNHGLDHCVYQGSQLLLGKEALWYARSRMTSSDFSRNVRQQLVLGAILDRFLSFDILAKIPKLYDTYINNITTNLDLGTVVSLSPTAAKLTDKSLIKQYFINQDVVTSWVTPGGAQVQLPNFNAIRSILKKALNAP